jgi:hypothetical protein
MFRWRWFGFDRSIAFTRMRRAMRKATQAKQATIRVAHTAGYQGGDHGGGATTAVVIVVGCTFWSRWKRCPRP